MTKKKIEVKKPAAAPAAKPVAVAKNPPGPAKAKTVKVLITSAAESREVPVSLNGRMTKIPVGVETEIPANLIGVLDASDCSYELVGN